MDFNIFDIFESITDAQIILSLNIESLFALAPNLSLWNNIAIFESFFAF